LSHRVVVDQLTFEYRQFVSAEHLLAILK
jgi:hypothetical protein